MMQSSLSLVPSLFSSLVMPRMDEFSQMQPHFEQTDEAVNIDLSVPGFKENEVEVFIEGNLLKVRGEHNDQATKEEHLPNGSTFHSKRYSSSNIVESFRLPAGLSMQGMTKRIEHGVLHICIPRLAIADRQQDVQPLMQPQQTSWPPAVTMQEAADMKRIVYTIPLPGVRKEDVRVNVAHHNLYLTVSDHANHDAAACSECKKHQEVGEEVKRTHADLHEKTRTLLAETNVRTADCASCAAHLSELQNLRQRSQAMEDAHIGKAVDPLHCVSCAAMKAEILDHIERDKRMRDVHGGCPTCVKRGQVTDEYKSSNAAYTKAHADLPHTQCSKFAERSIAIRLPYGTTAENITAAFDNGALTLTIENKHHMSHVHLH
jgi:HSP20 family molecular chaperone IbpA